MTKILKNFWVLEGLDGSGTTTQQQILVDRLSREGIKCFKTQEPTSFETGVFLRNVLSGNIAVPQSTMLICLLQIEIIISVIQRTA